MHQSHDSISVWYGKSDTPAPVGKIKYSTQISIIVAVQPIHVHNRVHLVYRFRNPTTVYKKVAWHKDELYQCFQLVKALFPGFIIKSTDLEKFNGAGVRDAVGIGNDWERNIQYFKAIFPALKVGDIVDYTAVCRCVNRQAPGPNTSKIFQSSFKIVTPGQQKLADVSNVPHTLKIAQAKKAKSKKPHFQPRALQQFEKISKRIRKKSVQNPSRLTVQQRKSLVIDLRRDQTKLETVKKDFLFELETLESRLDEVQRFGFTESDQHEKKDIVDLINSNRDNLSKLLEESDWLRRMLDRLRSPIPEIPTPNILTDVSTHHPILLLPLRLETRFIESELLIRIYPDQIFITNHEPGLTEDEFEAGKHYRDNLQEAISSGITDDKLEEAKKGAWRALASSLEPYRAAWVAKQVQADYDVNPPTLVPDSWLEAPNVTLLPDRFVVRLYRGDELCYERTGELITDKLPLFSDPTGDENLSDYELFDSGSSWISDFETTAVQSGMAFKISGLTEEDLEKGFSQVIAVGVKETMTPDESARHLVELFEKHYYTNGISFLTPYSPTNNTEATRTSFSESSPNIDDSYQTYCPDAIINVANSKFYARSNAARLLRNLGLDIPSALIPEFIHKMKNADDFSAAFIGEVNESIWPAIMGYMLFYLLDIDQIKDPKAWVALWDHYAQHIRPGGHIPSLLVGNIPYGILPVTRIGSQGNNEFIPSPLDYPDAENANLSYLLNFDARVYEVLKLLLEHWLQIAADPELVPKIGQSDDPDKELLNILAMEPLSSSYRVRPIIDDRLVEYLMALQGLATFTREPLYNLAGFDANAYLNAWYDSWDQLNEESFDFLKDIIIRSGGSGKANVDDFPIYKILSWGKGYNLSQPLVVPPGASKEDSPAYLKDFKGKSDYDADNVFLELLYRSWKIAERFKLYDRVEDAARILSESGISGAEIEIDLRKNFDTCTSRLDTWFTSFANKRLDTLRRLNKSGLYIGAFGIVEDLKPGERTAAAEDGGFIPSPTLDQATAAAVIRSTFQIYLRSDRENPAKLSLTSDRVRKTLRLLQGLSESLPISLKLGYQFERDLHEKGLDRYITVFRGVYPININFEESSEPNENRFSRNTVDGLTLANRMSAIREGQQDFDLSDILGERVSELPGIENDEKSLINVLLSLEAAVDGIGDFLLFESLHSLVRGSYDGAAAAANTLAGTGAYREKESVKTTVSGISVPYRVMILLKDSPVANIQGAGPRGMAEPLLETWIRQLLGDDFHEIGCMVHIKVHKNNAEQYEAVAVSLADLQIDALDFIHMAHSPPVGEETELEQRIVRYAYERTDNIADEPALFIDYENNDVFSRSINYAREVAHNLANCVSEGTFIRPSSMLRPDDAAGIDFSWQDYYELYNRVCRAMEGLAELLDITDTIEFLKKASRYGLKNAFPEVSAGTDVLKQKEVSCRKEVNARLARCRQLISEAKELASDPAQPGEYVCSGTGLSEPSDDDSPGAYSKPIDKLVTAMQALFGDSFFVLPAFFAPNPQELNNAFNQKNILCGHGTERLHLWLQQVALTHDRVQRLVTAMMLTGAWNDDLSDTANDVTGNDVSARPFTSQLYIAQLPFCSNRGWMGLSDEERSRVDLEMEEFGECEDSPDNSRSSETMSLVTWNCGAGETTFPYDFSTDRIAGIFIDDVKDIIPTETTDAGVTFQYDQPGAQAPNTFLLCVPGKLENTSANWTMDEIFGTIRDTFKLVDIRLVDLDALKKVGRFFPSMYLPTDPNKLDWQRSGPGFESPLEQ